jgi:hypothetical protein
MIYTDSLTDLGIAAVECQEALNRGQRNVTLEFKGEDGSGKFCHVRLWKGVGGERLSPGGRIAPTILVRVSADSVIKAYEKQKAAL